MDETPRHPTVFDADQQQLGDVYAKALLAVGLLLLTANAAVQAQGSCASHLLVSGYFSNSVAIFDACSGEFLRQLDDQGRIRGPQAVRLSPDGKNHTVANALFATMKMVKKRPSSND